MYIYNAPEPDLSETLYKPLYIYICVYIYIYILSPKPLENPEITYITDLESSTCVRLSPKPLENPERT